ncbi:DUF6884 domain-containing protein [Vibrio owensii]|uniref:DUF6884 domain-containing protein n=1 Tax=Vibrio owensii TaxID=696485 RepID=UPI0018F21995|nr:DUF6884 domain-containing protein [Vibrio owensii]
MQQMRLMWDTDLDSLSWLGTTVPDKPVLIISCSKDKIDAPEPVKAIELYSGQVFKFLRSHPFLEVFNVFILSAKWGLISAEEAIEHYDVIMDDVDQSEFLSVHSKGMHERLRSAAAGQRIYSFLPKGYRQVFESFMNSKRGEDIKRLSTGFYSCWHHRGNGEMKERMGKALRYELSGGYKSPFSTVYRSGTASNLEEIVGYSAAGQSIGSSLWHLDGKHSAFRAIVMAAYENRVFIDNGMLQLVKYGKPLDMDNLIARYGEFINEVKATILDFQSIDEDSLPDDIQWCFHHDLRRVLSNFTFVVPDDPYSPENAMRLLEKFRPQLAAMLGQGIELIIPVHKRREGKEDIRTRISEIYRLFDYHENIRIGIPTLDTETHPFALSSETIESIFSLKENGRLLVRKVHFLGQGDTNNYLPARSRNLLATLYEVDVTADSCRTRPTFKSKYVQQNADNFLRDAEMGLLSDAILEIKKCEFDDPMILNCWENYAHEYGVKAFVEAWNNSVKNRADHLVCPVNADELHGEDLEGYVADVLDVYLSNALYVDAWVCLNRAEYMQTYRISPILGNNKRTVILERVFGKETLAKTNAQRHHDWGRLMLACA